jgi:hypothetical protein
MQNDESKEHTLLTEAKEGPKLSVTLSRLAIHPGRED